jgi:transcriptional regulator of acetoin/glycerol metabolism
MADRGGVELAPSMSIDMSTSVFTSEIVNLGASRRRCVDRYRMDPGTNQRVVVLSGRELGEHREEAGEILKLAEEELSYIAPPLLSVGFMASFSNMAGLILHYRSEPSGDVEDERAGALWAEGLTGTNGVGTCVLEQRPTEVFRDQHFFKNFAHLSCTTAPVLSADSEMIAAINFSTGNPDVDPTAFRLVSGLARKVAEKLSNQSFRIKYRDADIISTRIGELSPVLLALDKHQNIIGANHAARVWLRWKSGNLPLTDIWSVFDHDADGLANAVRFRESLRLSRAGSDAIFVFDEGRPNAPKRPTTTIDVPAVSRPAAKRSNADKHPSVEECLDIDTETRSQMKLLRRVYGRGLPVLILGETGTGKDTLARALHVESSRQDRPYVAFNCAAVPETLIDSELFGYAVGAFTGARREGNQGRLIEADGGTLFLDEIGDMPLILQTRLLRVLESGEVSPLGSGKTRTIDVQVIAATNQNLRERVSAGLFREDLYYRLAGAVVNLPPLRQRPDMPDLARRLLKRMPECRDVEISQGAMACLAAHTWPGNVRELKFVLQRAGQICNDGRIIADDLLIESAGGKLRPVCPESVAETDTVRTVRGAMDAAERVAIAEALARHRGDVVETARELGISRATLYRRLRQHDIRPQTYG